MASGTSSSQGAADLPFNSNSIQAVSRKRVLTPFSLLFAVTLFTSAALLFWIQPLVAKMLLPLLGGSPSVWNTCMFFFQALLLAGYGYAHLSARHLGFKSQALLHVSLLALAAIALPVAVSEKAVDSLLAGGHPVGWLITVLLATVGLPFFVLSANGPLLQRWFSMSGHITARDPYYLYAASNLGSLIALLGFPLALEPSLRLQAQSFLWACFYGALVLGIVGCAWAIRESRKGARETFVPVARSGGMEESLRWGRRLKWVFWAFVPSSLMLGVTSYLSTNIAAFPLLWVLPLALYLLSMILVFSRREWLPQKWMVRSLPVLAVALTFVTASRVTHPAGLLMLLHLLFFFVAAMVCHGRLADDRPSAERLTEFYLWMSVGGVLGGLFNALLAPVLFSRIAEYPLVIVLACLAIFPRADAKRRVPPWAGMIVPVALGLLVAGLAWLVPRAVEAPVQIKQLLIFGLPLIVAYLLVDRPMRFAAALGAVLLGGLFYKEALGRVLHVERNFFGVSQVAVDPTKRFVRLYHGNTVHGQQFIEEDLKCQPLSYYHLASPVRLIIQTYNAGKTPPRVAVIGLGTGSMATYSKPGQEWTFYEIDPAVIRIARDTNYFTYLAHCAKGSIEIVQGDARLKLQSAPDGHFGLIVLDAFSSDTIPVHLLTREAMELYLSKLTDGGLLAFHISNRSLDLKPVVGDLALDAGLICLASDDLEMDETTMKLGKDPSQWVVMARDEAALVSLPRYKYWPRVEGRPGAKVWTDDFSNIVSVFRWN